MTKLTVKIPSPSVENIKALIFNNNLDLEDLLEHFMALVANSILLSGGTNLAYDAVTMTDTAIEAEIAIGTLPRYQDMKLRYEAINFEDELIKRINKARETYNDNCPEPDSLLLAQPISTWHHRWITAYIWVLICVLDHDGVFPLDKTIIELLLKRLEFAAVY